MYPRTNSNICFLLYNYFLYRYNYPLIVAFLNLVVYVYIIRLIFFSNVIDDKCLICFYTTGCEFNEKEKKHAKKKILKKKQAHHHHHYYCL
jgi:hypothetical protein